jgi:hypothetical protein
LKVACCISHIDEPSIWACLGTVAALEGASLDPVRVLIGKKPLATSINAALDVAHGANADLLLHLRSDVLLTPGAIKALVAAHGHGGPSVVIGRTYDPLIDMVVPGHVFLFDMRLLADRFRFQDVPDPHGEFHARVERETGRAPRLSAGEDAVAYWRPVWAAAELYSYFREHLPTVTDPALRARMESFLSRGLEIDPNNKALMAGRAGLRAASATHGVTGEAFAFDRCSKELGLDGTEYYVRHKFYASLAKGILDSSVQCVCERPSPHVPLIHWR